MTRHPQRHYRGRDNSRAAVHCSEDSRELQGFRHPRLAGDSPGFAARLMLARGGGNIFFTGATASLRGGSSYAAFASAKFGLRAVAQLMARELGPKNFHVAHLIIDSGVDTAWVRERREQIWGKEALDNPDLLMPPASVAGAYWQLYRQPKSAWTFEMEIRPFGEKW